MATYYRIDLPKNYDWEGVDFRDSSLWGTGNEGQNLWGWSSRGNLLVTEPQKWLDTEDDRWYIGITPDPSPESNEGLAFISRCILNDGSPGVFSSNQVLPIE